MGMTDNTKSLIKAISINDMQTARKCAVACLSEDTTAKNAAFVSKYKPILERTASMMQLPPNLTHKLIALDMASIFREDRYYLTNDAKQIAEHILKMKKASSILAGLQLHYLNATMLYGKSGTGKTTLAKYIAYRMKLPYIYLNFSQIIDSYMGKTSNSLHYAFDFVKQNACVFVLDELDAIAIRRSNSSDQGVDGEMNRITITLMQELDSLPNDVILIGATNRIDRIDEALLNRFPFKREILVLSDEEKYAMVEQFLSTVDVLTDVQKEKIKTAAVKLDSQREIVNAMIQHIAEFVCCEDVFEEGESHE